MNCYVLLGFIIFSLLSYMKTFVKFQRKCLFFFFFNIILSINSCFEQILNIQNRIQNSFMKLEDY